MSLNPRRRPGLLGFSGNEVTYRKRIGLDTGAGGVTNPQTGETLKTLDLVTGHIRRLYKGTSTMSNPESMPFGQCVCSRPLCAAHRYVIEHAPTGTKFLVCRICKDLLLGGGKPNKRKQGE